MSYQPRKRNPSLYGETAPGVDPINLEVILQDGESVESLIRRFLRKFKKNRLADEIKSHESYVQPSEVRRRARERRKIIARKITAKNSPHQD